jgi:hypothetical protein
VNSIEEDEEDAPGIVTGVIEVSEDDARAMGIDRYREAFTATVNDDGLLEKLHLEYVLSDPETAEFITALRAQQEEDDGGGDDEEAGDAIEVALAAQPGGNQPGQAFIFGAGDGVSGVFVGVEPGEEGIAQPAHFHTGTCASPGPVVHPLASIIDGVSFTYLSAGIDELADSGLIINVHKSAAQPGSYVSCGVVAAAAEAPAPPPSPTRTPSGIAAPDTGSGGVAGGAAGAATYGYALLAVAAAALATAGWRLRRR